MKVYIDKKNPVFPVYDMNYDWSTFSQGPIPIFFDMFLYRNLSDGQFMNEFLSHKVVDSIGKEFEIIGRRILSKWRHFIPGVKKSKLKFVETGNVYSLEETKKILILHINGHIDDKNIKGDWIKKIINSKSYEELFS